MTRIKITQLFLILMFTTMFYTINGDWIDPHSMDTNVKAKMRSFDKETTDLKQEYCSKIRICESDLYLKRIIRLLLNNANLDKDDFVDYLIGHINIKLSKKEYEFLLNFSQDDNSREGVFSEVSSIFEVALQKPSLERYKEMMLTFEEQLYFLIVNPTTGAFAISVVLLYVIYKLLRANFTWKSILKYLVFLLYVADFIITYLEIRKDEEIDHMVKLKKIGTVPPECDPQKMSWWSYMKTQFESTFYEHPCKTYYEMTANSELKHLVAPTRILTRQFRTLIVEPTGDIGEAFGKFGRQMFTNLPWGLNIAIFPIMLIGCLLFLFIILVFITKPRLKISFFHLFTIEIGESHRPEPRLELEARPVIRAIQRDNNRREVGYNEQHRALIEEASNDNCSSSEEQTNENVAVNDIGVKEEGGAQTEKSLKKEDGNCSSAVNNVGPNTQAELLES